MARVVSIHALVKRATRSAELLQASVYVSIHALVKRATAGHSLNRRAEAKVSIHALVKRATL